MKKITKENSNGEKLEWYIRKTNKNLREKRDGRISVIEDKIKAMYTSFEKNVKSKIIKAQSILKIWNTLKRQTSMSSRNRGKRGEKKKQVKGT